MCHGPFTLLQCRALMSLTRNRQSQVFINVLSSSHINTSMRQLGICLSPIPASSSQTQRTKRSRLLALNECSLIKYPFAYVPSSKLVTLCYVLVLLFLHRIDHLSMSAEVKSALLIAAPGSWSNKARVSSVTPRTKSVDLISRGIILEYQAREGAAVTK